MYVAQKLLRRKLQFSDADFTEMVSDIAHLGVTSTWNFPILAPLIGLLERRQRDELLSEELRTALARLAETLVWQGNTSERKLRNRIMNLSGGPQSLPLKGGEAWSDAVMSFVEQNKKDGTAWTALLNYCASAVGGAPSKKWRDAASKLVIAIKWREFRDRQVEQLILLEKPRIHPIHIPGAASEIAHWYVADENSAVIKGLIWCCALKSDEELARTLTRVALTSFKKLPGIGPRLVKIGNASICSLGNMPGDIGLAQLAILKARIKFIPAQKMLEKAFQTTAERLGNPRDEIEEMAAPTYGLDEVGLRRETFDDYTAELRIDGSNAAIAWKKPDGKPLKSVPAAVKKAHADELKELTQAVKDIQRMLPAQRERIDTLHLAQKSWPLLIWRERYLNHPLVGVIARRLIWRFSGKGKTDDGVFQDGRLLDARERALEWLDDDTKVELWHPIGQPVEAVLEWRRFLEQRQIQQPFKQAHREVYLLTDAERNTRNYSNRYAAHVLRQHQFNALCAARGWKNKLRLMVDAEYPPATLNLPKWNLRAEYWIEGIGHEPAADINDAGVYHRLVTDQVRFYRLDAVQLTAHAGGGGYGTHRTAPVDPLALEEIPPLVFSEVMRDVDLFVGVASVGNDPTWQDGGPGAHFRDYWQNYAFGDLTETSQTRKAVLERLIPRLAIADRCRFEDKFLIVRGELRTYKIHLGSSNILMEPNDQYLCIVPTRGVALGGKGERLFLPFEGDERLSVILSKALMLAADSKIKDATILSQIRRK